jgi:hypothetical protein
MELLESSFVRPRQARYQAALRPDIDCVFNSTVPVRLNSSFDGDGLWEHRRTRNVFGERRHED